MHSKLAKRVLGAMVSAAVMVSMIPAMALADGADGLKNVSFSYNNYRDPLLSGSSYSADGITLTVGGGVNSQVGSSYFGIDAAEGHDNTGTYTFSIDPEGAYAGGKIVGISIPIPQQSGGSGVFNCEFLSGEGWSNFGAGSTFTWSGEADATSFTMGYTSGSGSYFSYNSITVTVRVPVNSITVEPDEGEENDFMYVDDDSFSVVATVAPGTTTYDYGYMAWTSSDEGVFTVDNFDGTLAELAPIDPGTATVTATLGGVEGTYDITVYDHVEDISISDTEEELNVGYTMSLEAYPTNKSDVRAEDWTVEFTSSDPDIASVTVVDGIAQITALEEGNATITATLTDKSQPIVDEDSNTSYKTYTAECVIEVTEVPATTMFRLFYEDTGEHLYTANEGERDYLKNHGWNYEGGAWLTPTTSNTPVYRLFNANNGEHFYSSNLGEIEGLVAIGWRNEGIAFYADDFETVAVYRLFNPDAQSNTHMYSTNEGEIAYLVANGWQNEGPAFYASALDLR